MSLTTSLNDLSDIQRETVLDNLTIRMDPGKYGQYVRAIYAFAITGDPDKMITIPFHYGQAKMGLSRRRRTDFPNASCTYGFNGILRETQQVVKNEALKQLNRNGTVVLSLHCGFGKTVTAICLAHCTRLPTLVIVNKVILMNQWKQSIIQFCPDAEVGLLQPSKKLPAVSCDFYIVNAVNVPKFYDTEEGRYLLQSIGTLIVDECHLIMAETLVQSLLHVDPRYMIAASATPYRPDSLNEMIDLYFGPERIVRKLFRQHIVYEVESGFSPKSQTTTQGNLNWGSILDAQAHDDKRNELIVEIIQKHPDRVFLVLVKRIHQGEILLDMLHEKSVSCTSLLGTQQTFDHDAQVLIGTVSKIGTGFDHSRLNALLLAADVEEYFIQYLGRIFRTKQGTPAVFDIVDNHPVLRKHYATRKSIYIEHGGEIRSWRRYI